MNVALAPYMYVWHWNFQKYWKFIKNLKINIMDKLSSFHEENVLRKLVINKTRLKKAYSDIGSPNITWSFSPLNSIS